MESPTPYQAELEHLSVRLTRDATNPDCPPERLREIVLEWQQFTRSSRQDAAPIRAVAAHPNAPPDLLARLLPWHVEAFCANPIAPLVALEPEAFLANVESDGLSQLLNYPKAPAPLLALLASGAYPSDRVTETARLHICLAGEVLPDTWRQEVSRYWKEQLAKATPETQEGVAEMVDLGLAPAFLFPGGAPPLPMGMDQPPTTVTLAHLRVVQQKSGSAPGGPYLSLREAFALWAAGFGRSTPPRFLQPLLLRLLEAPFLAHLLVQCLLRDMDTVVRRIALRHRSVTPAIRDTYTAARVAATSASCASMIRQAHITVLLRGSRTTSTHYLPNTSELPEAAELPGLLASLHSPSESQLHDLSASSHWRSHLFVALCLPRLKPGGDFFDRTRSWLQSHTNASNRLVRAVTQARLRGEDFAWKQ